MFVLESILNQAGAVWVTETLPLPLRHAEKVIKQRRENLASSRRFRLRRVNS